MKAAEILNKAADLIETKGWTQGAYARNAKGSIVSPHDAEAECFCMVGSVLAACPTGSDDAFVVVQKIGVGEAWNDWPSRTKEEVVTALRAAAKEVA